MTIDELNAEIGNAMQSLLLAAQGAFSTARGAFTIPGASRVALERFEQARGNAAMAIGVSLQAFALSLGSGYESFRLTSAFMEQAKVSIASVLAQFTQQLARAIRVGSGNPAAMMLKRSHGAVGELVGRQMTTLTLTARDNAGREWKSPVQLVQTYAREFAVRATVITQVEDMRAAGYTHAYLGDEQIPLDAVQRELNALFHPNSKEFLRADLHA